jgi:YgiT-type zinc finger domain-containing protein
MRRALVKTVIWQGDRVFLVEDIPALVCDSCLEQYYDDETTETLRRLMDDGFPGLKAKREILVPVFSLEGETLSTSHVSAQQDISPFLSRDKPVPALPD